MLTAFLYPGGLTVCEWSQTVAAGGGLGHPRRLQGGTGENKGTHDGDCPDENFLQNFQVYTRVEEEPPMKRLYRWRGVADSATTVALLVIVIGAAIPFVAQHLFNISVEHVAFTWMQIILLSVVGVCVVLALVRTL